MADVTPGMLQTSKRALESLLAWKPYDTYASGYPRSRWFYEGVVLLGDWNGCPYVNPLCPDDLCFLPYAHPGFDQGVHMLGTSSEPSIMRYKKLHPLGPKADQHDLIEEGWRRQKELFPEEVHGRPPKRPTEVEQIDPDVEIWL